MNIDKQAAYWLESAREDWEAARQLLQGGKGRHGLFFVHLTLEKTFKALYCKQMGKVPPKIHNLVRLAELAGILLTDEQHDICAVINRFNDQGRYPETASRRIGIEKALKYAEDAEGICQWLIKKL